MNAETAAFNPFERRKLDELVDLAVQATCAPTATAYTNVIESRIRELEGSREDEYLSAMLEWVPNRETARTIQRCWESTSESASIDLGRPHRVSHLFCMAAIVQTEDALTSTEFDELLDFALARPGDPYCDQIDQGGSENLRFSPHTFSADDLLSLRLPQVRTWARYLGREREAATSVAASGPRTSVGGRWRARTFLRFWVGAQITNGCEPSKVASLMRQRIGRRLQRTLSSIPTCITMCQVRWDGTFFDNLWNAVWQYQMLRVGERILAITAKDGNKTAVSAMLSVHGQPDCYRVHIALFDSSRDELQGAYAARERPYHDPMPMMKRLSRRLRLANVSCVLLLPDGRSNPNSGDATMRWVKGQGSSVPVPYVLPL